MPEALERIRKIYRKHASRFNSHTNEAQTERDFIRPVLDVLWGSGCYQVQAPIPNVEGRRQPDYAFFRTAEVRQEADKRKGSLEYWRDVPVLGDAKAWEASLDRQASTGENPSAQICNYLYRSRVRWGILTNGRQWRLYERDKSSAGGIYYEVNLADFLERGDAAFFKYFYLFFRRETFIPDAKTGLSFVEKVFKESADYATGVGERLKESVYDALRHLMNGFLVHPANGLDSGDSATVNLVHEDSLILLYRLLFILYAEDYGILPCEMPPYSIYSLRTLHKEINERLLSKPYPATPTSLWFRLCNLFTLTDQGLEEDGEIVAPAYNGSLFSPEKHPHIAYLPQPNVRQWQIGDRYLAEAIDLLAYERKQWDKPRSDDVDYATLDVQHLGSIYEGLLELQPHVAREPLVEIAEKGKSVFRPESQVTQPRPIHRQPPRRIRAGEVYLVTNRGERKATGSYYTPKYIVDYIVENTVGPVAEGAAKKVAELSAEVGKEIKKLQKTNHEWEKSPARDAPEHIAGLNKLIEEQKHRLLEPYLALKILDPATGSGHFLVGAADFLSMAMATDPNLLPIDEMGDEKAQPFYKRLIVERCLCGVDLNPLAVELAKLSLWLHTVSRNKALSFLDHHLRCGNSLIGVRIEDDLMKTPPQFNERGRRVKTEGDLVSGMYEALHERHLEAILDLLHKISDIPTHDAATEKLKEIYYAELETVREKFRAVANCWLAPCFGVPVTPDQYQRAVQSLRNDAQSAIGSAELAEARNPQSEEWFQAAQAVAQQKHFFHWELEFPEVFFDKTGFKPKDQRGFDAVIGNPPYLFGEEIPEAVRAVFSRFDLAVGQYDVYWLFYEIALHVLLKRQACHGYIVPDPILARDQTQLLRARIADHHRVCCIAQVGTVFDDPNVSAAVLVWQKEGPTDGLVSIAQRKADEITVVGAIKQEVLRLFPEKRWLIHLDIRTLDLLRRVFAISAPLGRLAVISRGEELGKGDLLDAANRQSEPILVGEDVVPLGFAVPSKHIHSTDIHKPRRIYASPKIVFVKTGQRVVATVDTEGLVTLQSVYNIQDAGNNVHLGFLVALLKSILLSVVAKWTFTGYKQLFPQFNQTTVASLPIPRIAFTTPKAERARLLKEGRRLYQKEPAVRQPSYADFLNSDMGRWLDERLNADQADVVHDLLAFLAEQMIEMNKEKHTEVKGFLAWLERHIGAAIEDLHNKTKLREFCDYDLQTLLGVLNRNGAKLQKPVTRAVEEEIEREFRQSMDKLAPLKMKIAATNRLIDLIVCRLYGLTDEEAAIVEGASETRRKDDGGSLRS